MTLKSTSFDLGEIQFYWRTLETSGDETADVPAFLPFEFDFLPDVGLIIQKRNATVMDWLKTVYSKDFNVGYLQEGHGLAEAYGGDFLGFIQSFAADLPSPRTALEIGCGGGYLLKKLQGMGFECSGMDPSPVAVRSAAKLGFQLIEDFYPPRHLPSPTSLVYHYDVLEHVVDPVAFLREHQKHLLPDGMIIVAVPDCTTNIAHGDISMAIHEHLNYFDGDSLAATVTAAGYSVKRVARSAYGGVLYCAAQVSKGAGSPDPGPQGKFEQFRGAAEKLRADFCSYIEAVHSSKESSLGIYVPIRSMPYLAKLGIRDGFRFFDDEPTLHRRFFDGYPVSVENKADLLARPVTHLLITSFSFDRVIAKAVNDASHSPIEIRSLRDFIHVGN